MTDPLAGETDSPEPQLLCFGANHKTLPIEFREQAAISTEETQRLYARLAELPEFHESVVLSTCNRFEIYALADKDFDAGAVCLDLLAQVRGLDLAAQRDRFYVLRAHAAADHLFQVASSLDSMIVGETEIQGQVKEAYHQAQAIEATGFTLNHLFQQAFRVGSRARSETEIGYGTVSVSYAAVELVEKVLHDLSRHSALLIGAGATGRTAAQNLKKRKIRELYIVNRTPERAAELAAELEAVARDFGDLPTLLTTVDVVVSATAAPEQIMSAADFRPLSRARGRAPLVIVDLAVPRDFDPDINKDANVFLSNVDDLQRLVDQNAQRRQVEQEKVYGIIKEELAGFLAWRHSLGTKSVIVALQQQCESIRAEELKRYADGLSPEAAARIDEVTRALVKRIIARPIHQISRGGADGEFVDLDVVQRLFNLPTPRRRSD